MLTFVGLGLYDEESITVEGRDALADADRAVAEFYTSHLVDATPEDLSAIHGIDIEVRDRAGVEQQPEDILAAAEDDHVAFLTAGDTMISTTHVDLRLRAIDRGIDTRVIHGVTAQTAASGLTGLQNYRFGKSVTLPFPESHGAGEVPTSVVESIEANRERGLHTLVYLDIKADRDAYLTGDAAAGLLASGWTDTLGVVVARAGSPDPIVAADRLSALSERDFGDPLHLLVIPGDLHHVESEALAALGDAPAAALATRER
jgi:diphthine synthase